MHSKMYRTLKRVKLKCLYILNFYLIKVKFEIFVLANERELRHRGPCESHSGVSTL